MLSVFDWSEARLLIPPKQQHQQRPFWGFSVVPGRSWIYTINHGRAVNGSWWRRHRQGGEEIPRFFPYKACECTIFFNQKWLGLVPKVQIAEDKTLIPLVKMGVEVAWRVGCSRSGDVCESHWTGQAREQTLTANGLQAISVGEKGFALKIKKSRFFHSVDLLHKKSLDQNGDIAQTVILLLNCVSFLLQQDTAITSASHPLRRFADVLWLKNLASPGQLRGKPRHQKIQIKPPQL